MLLSGVDTLRNGLGNMDEWTAPNQTGVEGYEGYLNDRVVTIGGIHGTIVSTSSDSDDVTIKVDENSNTRIRITRTAIQTVLNQKDGGGKDTA